MVCIVDEFDFNKVINQGALKIVLAGESTKLHMKHKRSTKLVVRCPFFFITNIKPEFITNKVGFKERLTVVQATVQTEEAFARAPIVPDTPSPAPFKWQLSPRDSGCASSPSTSMGSRGGKFIAQPHQSVTSSSLRSRFNDASYKLCSTASVASSGTSSRASSPNSSENSNNRFTPQLDPFSLQSFI